MRNSITGALVLVTALLPAGRGVRAQAQYDTQTIYWQAASVLPSGGSNPFSELYGSLNKALDAGARLKTQQVAVVGAKSVEQILRDNRLFEGVGYSKEVDLFLCKLNRAVCREDDGKPAWKLRRETLLNLPSIEYKPIRLNRPVQKTTPGSLSTLVSTLKGCEKFDETCKQEIVNLNSGDEAVLAPDFEGTVNLPVRGYRALIPLDVPLRADGKSNHSAINSMLPRQAVLIPPAERLGRAGTESNGAADPAVGDRWTVLKLINHPFVSNPKYDASNGSVNVLVVDRWASPTHCLYSQNVLPNSGEKEPTGTAAIGPRKDECGAVARADPDIDHATHLIGIIAARLDAPSGPGLNPSAWVYPKAANIDQLTDPRISGALGDELDAIKRGPTSPRIVNMSFKYQSVVNPADRLYRDPLETFIINSTDKLFVVAAAHGLANDVPRSRNCELRPVCLDARNVLTVAATNLAPRPSCPALIANTNRGEGIDLAAPGENIVSSILKNNVGMLSGSSQAAPLVTGAASLLFAKNGSLSALRVKNRLIYTADICPELNVFGGRLNVDRALSFEIVELRLRGEAQPLTGWLANDSLAMSFNFLAHDSTLTVPIAVRSVRRFARLADGTYTMFYHRDMPSQESSLLTKLRGTLRPPEVKLLLIPNVAGRPVREFPITDVEDYVARFEPD